MKVADFGAREAVAAERRALWREARRILAVRLDNLGDVLMTSPAIRALKAGTRDRRVTLLASPAGAQVARYVPELDTALVYDAPWMPANGAKPAKNGTDRSADMRMIGTLRGLGFDAAVIFTVYSQSALPAALLCTLAGIPLRLAHCRENPYGLLTDWRADPEPHALLRHEVRRQLDLVAQVGCTTADERLSFHIPPRDRAAALQRLERTGIDPRQRFVVVHAGASAASRRYPREHYVSALSELARTEPALQFVFTGSSAEAELAEWIRARVPAARGVSVAGSLSLAELGAALEAAALLISNNTGPVHIAAAMGTPVVDLYALTNPQHAPWQTAQRVLFHDVPCRFCYRSVCPQGHHHCLRLLAPERVAAAARALLSEGADRWVPAPPPVAAQVSGAGTALSALSAAARDTPAATAELP